LEIQTFIVIYFEGYTFSLVFLKKKYPHLVFPDEKNVIIGILFYFTKTCQKLYLMNNKSAKSKYLTGYPETGDCQKLDPASFLSCI